MHILINYGTIRWNKTIQQANNILNYVQGKTLMGISNQGIAASSISPKRMLTLHPVTIPVDLETRVKW